MIKKSKSLKYIIHITLYQKGSYLKYVRKGQEYITYKKKYAKTFDTISEAKSYMKKHNLKNSNNAKYGNLKYDVVKK